jgi:membrane associated rhomboid family serine protease
LAFFVGNTKIEVLNSVEMSLFDFGLILVGICVIQIAIGSNVWGNIAHLNGIILGLITAVIYKKLKLWQHN